MVSVVRARLSLNGMSSESLEDQLVRRGARHARVVGDGVVLVTVAAGSEADAAALVHSLLVRVGASFGPHDASSGDAVA